MRLKRLTIGISLFFIIITQCIHPVNAADTQSLNIYSHAALLINMNTGRVLYDRNSTEILYPASITKVMTAILAIENADLNSIARVSYNAVMSVPFGYSTANLQLDEELSVENLLYVLMLPSACDAAVVLSEHVSLSEESFINLMNEKALELGCTNTNFVNASGVHDDNHYSTARDLALITEYAMKNPIFRTIVSTTTYTLPSTNKYPNRDRVFINTNRLIRLDNSSREDNYYYKHAIGVKTGMTDEAGETLSTVASQDGQEYLVILLRAGYTGGLSERYLDSTTLFNFAFNTYTRKNYNQSG